MLILAAFTQSVLAEQLDVPFDLCARSETWTRPPAAVQAKIWSDPRYRGSGPDALEWTHSFIPAEPDSASVSYMIMNLSGVWTDRRMSSCPWRGSERGKWTELWSLNFHVSHISLTGLTYTITVEPHEQGYEIIQFRRPEALGNSRAELRFITAQGTVVTTIFDPR